MSGLQDHRDFAEMAIARAGMDLSATTLQPLARPGLAMDFERTTTGFFFNELQGSGRFFFVASPTRFPDFLAVVANRTNAAIDAVGPRLGRRICAPHRWGSVDGRSYIVYKRLELMSGHRIGMQVQKYWTVPPVFRWLTGVQAVTAQDVTGGDSREKHFVQALRRLEDDADVSPGVEAAARACQRLLGEGRARPMLCLEHGDFWLGNIMIDPARGKVGAAVMSDFRVIDWGGSKLDGYPGIDAVRFVLSAFGTGRRSTLVLRSYSRAMGLSREDLVLHVYSALGYFLGVQTEFPKERMNALIERVHVFLEDTGSLDGLPDVRAVRMRLLPARSRLRSPT